VGVPTAACTVFCTVPWLRFQPEQLYGPVYTNVEEMLGELDIWMAIPKMMIVGELQDVLNCSRR